MKKPRVKTPTLEDFLDKFSQSKQLEYRGFLASFEAFKRRTIQDAEDRVRREALRRRRDRLNALRWKKRVQRLAAEEKARKAKEKEKTKRALDLAKRLKADAPGEAAALAHQLVAGRKKNSEALRKGRKEQAQVAS